MDDNARTTQAVGTGDSVVSSIPDVDAATKAQQQQQPVVMATKTKYHSVILVLITRMLQNIAILIRRIH